ncbi:MAG TPA: sigma-70 family RNA polymerase sigma factor [Gemmataceae bacterium]|nr:sigma-70 family RNA polymerase sigma factor [Gemmataceae bacterium]
MKTVIRHLRRAALLQQGDGPADGQLLELFLAGCDETAFEALVRRHGPMVLGVCRRVLRNAHDAEDAFQATFLVLVRKAASLRSRELLANWLYGVAYRTAMKARTMNAKHRAREKQASEMPRSETSADSTHEELLAQLDHELSRLPDKYRVPVVLCELEGRSRKEVARLLGMPEGTLSWRLAHAKKMLAKRLSRHGMAISGVALAAVMAPSAASACLRASTVKTVLSAGSIPAKVLALTEGVMKAMFLSKLKITVCAATLMLAAGIGTTGLTYRGTAEEPRRLGYTRSEASRPQTDDFDALRLEIESLRKELRATKERVKALEEEARVQKEKGRSAIPPTSAEVRPDAVRGQIGRNSADLKDARRQLLLDREHLKAALDKEVESTRRTRSANELLSQAESALKKLSEKTDDQQLIETLERALKKLKEKEKPNAPGEERNR